MNSVLRVTVVSSKPWKKFLVSRDVNFDEAIMLNTNWEIPKLDGDVTNKVKHVETVELAIPNLINLDNVHEEWDEI